MDQNLSRWIESTQNIFRNWKSVKCWKRKRHDNYFFL